VGHTEGKSQLGRLRCRWVNNITTDLREIGRSDMDWTDLAEDMGRVEDSCEQRKRFVDSKVKVKVILRTTFSLPVRAFAKPQSR
jgi:hypothetical protein